MPLPPETFPDRHAAFELQTLADMHQVMSRGLVPPVLDWTALQWLTPEERDQFWAISGGKRTQARDRQTFLHRMQEHYVTS